MALQELKVPRAQEMRAVERNFSAEIIPGNFCVGVDGVGIWQRRGLVILRRYFFA
jgi:hypothetical protein